MIQSRLIPLFLAGLAVTQLMIGGNALPNWLATISIKMDQDPVLYLRLLVMLETVAALLCLTMGRRATTLAWFALAAIGFSSLASCSASLGRNNSSELLSSVVVLLIVIALGVALASGSRHTATKNEDEPKTARLPGGLRWTFFTAAGLIGVSLIGNLPLSQRTLAEGRPLKTMGPEVAGDVSIFNLAPDMWESRRIEEIELTTYVPELSRLTAEGTSTVVLYNRGCGDCHDLFEVHFSEGYDHQVIAIEVPPTKDAELAPGYRTDDVVCKDCIYTSLPAGPLWLVSPPVVMTVTDGVITCCNGGRDVSCLD